MLQSLVPATAHVFIAANGIALAFVTTSVTSREWNTSALTANFLIILSHLALLDHRLLPTVTHSLRLID